MKRCKNCGRLEECEEKRLWKTHISDFDNFRCWCPVGCLLIKEEIEL